jgi:preprotein translocase subunit YajC
MLAAAASEKVMHVLNQFLMQMTVAQAEAAEGASGIAHFFGEGAGSAVPFVLMFGAMYFIMIRPMLKQNRTQQDMLKALKKDDEVVTSGGIYGKVQTIEDRLVVLEIANGVRIKILRSNIAGKWNPSGPVPAAVVQAKE